MLKKYLEKYKELTVKMIEVVNSDDMDLFQQLINSRQNVIHEMNNLNYSSQQFKGIVEELKILELEEKLKETTITKKEEYKSKISNVKLNQNAHKSYNRNFLSSSHFIKEKR